MISIVNGRRCVCHTLIQIMYVRRMSYVVHCTTYTIVCRRTSYVVCRTLYDVHYRMSTSVICRVLYDVSMIYAVYSLCNNTPLYLHKYPIYGIVRVLYTVHYACIRRTLFNLNINYYINMQAM